MLAKRTRLLVMPEQRPEVAPDLGIPVQIGYNVDLKSASSSPHRLARINLHMLLTIPGCSLSP